MVIHNNPPQTPSDPQRQRRESYSPFVDEELFAAEDTQGTQQRTLSPAWYESESPFLHAFEQGYEAIVEPEVEALLGELGEEGVDEGFFKSFAESYADLDQGPEAAEFLEEPEEEDFDEALEKEAFAEDCVGAEEKAEADEFLKRSAEESDEEAEEEALSEDYDSEDEEVEAEEFLERLEDKETDEEFEEAFAKGYTHDAEELEAEEFGEELYEEEFDELDESSPSGVVTFPSGESLSIVSGPEGTEKTYYDPSHSGNPLLDTSGVNRLKQLSKNFTVGEFARSGRERFDRARIDPRLIECLQKLRDHLGKMVEITSGYRSYEHNEYLWRQCEERKKKGEKCTVAKESQHLRGQAADIQVAGMNGLDLAKAAIDACGCDVSVGVASTYIHVDVGRKPRFWGYGKSGEKYKKAIEDYRQEHCAKQPMRPPLDLKEAVRLNRYYSKQLGWNFDQIRRFMGLDATADEQRLVMAVARWQEGQPGLKVDGIVGPFTWRQVQKAMGTAGAAPPGALVNLGALSSPDTVPTEANALSIMKTICAYHGIPTRVGYTILEHEGGVQLFVRKHPDGVMQTISRARNTVIPLIPRPIKLAVLGLPSDDKASDSALTSTLKREFSRRLAVQIAVGVQELMQNLGKFNGYVALAFQAYNAGAGWAYYTATRGKAKQRPSGISDRQWEELCRTGAALLHQSPRDLRIDPGVWQCDSNIPAWFSHIPVFDKQSGLQLIAFKYLRSISECIRSQKPTSPCDRTTPKRREAGSGPVRCKPTRDGALDKLYDPVKLGERYYQVAQSELSSISDDKQPLKVQNGQLIKMPA